MILTRYFACIVTFKLKFKQIWGLVCSSIWTSVKHMLLHIFSVGLQHKKQKIRKKKIFSELLTSFACKRFKNIFGRKFFIFEPFFFFSSKFL